MANYWTTPKINWATSDGIGYDDLNRIEANIKANRDANFRRVQGFGFSVSNAVSGQDGVITIKTGSAYSTNGFPIRSDALIVKNLLSWGQGSGATIGGMAPSVAPVVAPYTWYYIFAVMNPTDGSVDIQFDSSQSGANISAGLFIEKRYIGCFKTGLYGGVNYGHKLIEMYSTGDDVFINPNSMNVTMREVPKTDLGNNIYAEATLTAGGGSTQLPPREVLARLSVAFEVNSVIAFGAISKAAGFTKPTNLLSGTTLYQAEFLHLLAYSATDALGTAVDFEMVIDAAGKFYVAVRGGSNYHISLAVRGFKDERLL